MNFGTIFTLSSLKAVYTYDSESYSLSDLHANRMPIQLSVRFPFPILEIIDELKKMGSVKFRKTFYHPGNRESDVELDASSCVCVDLHKIGWRIKQRIGCKNVRVDGPLVVDKLPTACPSLVARPCLWSAFFCNQA
jgi:hypothetical protein